MSTYPYPQPPNYQQQAPPHHAPCAGKEVEYLQVKTRYRDQNMLATYKMHIFADEMILSQLAGQVFSMYPKSEIKRNSDEHCITLTKLGKLTHFAELQLFRTLSRHGFSLRSSTSSTIPINDCVNDLLFLHVFSR